MPRRNFVLPLAVVVGLALFFYALIHVLLLRYERGDLYPAYSTLRTDPLGARAFYEALGGTGKYAVNRGFVSLRRELREKPTSLFFLGLDSMDLDSFTPEEIKSIDDYLQNGGRIVIALSPEGTYDESSSSTDKKKSQETKEKKAAKEKSAPESAPETPVAARTQQEKYEREKFRKDQEADDKLQPGEFPPKFEPSIKAVWGFGTEQHLANENSAKGAPAPEYSRNGDVLAVSAAGSGNEAKVPWKSATYFLRLEPEWQVLYTAKNKPVFIERHWGKGELLVASDSYFLSNEALRDDRSPLLLSAVAGAEGDLLFDEVHLGTEEKEGVMVLAEKFRLEGYLYGMLVVAALFLWRNSVPLVPPHTAVSGPSLLGGAVSGKDSRSGLINLLRRNIAEKDILNTCLTEWKRTMHSGRGRLKEKGIEMDALLASSGAAPVEIVQAYQQLREINTGSRTKETHATKS